MNARAVEDSSCGADSSAKAFCSPRKSESWRCIPEPFWSDFGFGMNVA